MKIGVIDLLVDARAKGWTGSVYSHYFQKQFASIMPQVVAVWCRQLGHQVHYATYHGQQDPKSLLPDDLDVVFVAAFSKASALAYALAKLYRREGTLTVIGGPHATCFASDCIRFFDIVVEACDKTLIDDILRGDFAPPAIVTSGRPLTDFPSVEERMPEIAVSNLSRGRPILSSTIPLMASIGCPYTCNFCTVGSTRYAALSPEAVKEDLRYVSRHLPGVAIIYHDPNFAVRFDETMDLIETVPKGHRNRYIMESTLSILKPSRLRRLRETGCLYVAPSVESWTDYANKAGVGDRSGRDKLEHVIEHFKQIGAYVPGMDANFIFGTDGDRGTEPVELTKEFIRRLPAVFPSIQIPTPYGATPLFDEHLAQGRILREMPFAFYYTPYLVTTLRHYGPAEFYGHLIDILSLATGNLAVARRLASKLPPVIRFLHTLRVFAVKQDLSEYRRLRHMLLSDPGFRAFHEGRSRRLPAYYRENLRRRLGRYVELVSEADLRPVLARRTASPDRPAAAVEPVRRQPALT